MTAHLRPNVTRAAEGLPRRRFTVVEVEAMVAAGLIQNEDRLELIGGELVPMSPKGLKHEMLKAALVHRWVLCAPRACMVVPATTFRLSDDTYLEVDVLLCDRAGGLGGLAGHSALLVVEIADSSLRYDIGRKAALYASFGVRELWVIDAVKLTTRVFREPSAEGFGTTWDVASGDIVAPLVAPGAFALRLADLAIE